MLLEPLLLHFHHLINLCLVFDQLRLLHHEIAYVVPEQIIRNYEAFIAFCTLLPGIWNAIGVIIVLTRCAYQNALFLQLKQIVYIVWQLLHLGLNLLHFFRLGALGNQVPLALYFLLPEQVVWQEAKHAMTSTLPVLYCDLDPLAHELLVIAEPHRDILHIKDN